MRIACVHIPQLSLQCVTRVEPSLRSERAALAVVGLSVGPIEGRPALTSPIVLACSRAAWALGVRLGMTAVTARALSPDIRVVHADPAMERDAVRGLADALLAIAPTVDLGGRLGVGGAHLAMYVEVPAKTRGQTFGERVVELAATLGLQARVGIADDRFTAWVAASSPVSGLPRSGTEGGDVVTVPRGGSAAFLSPRPLSLLAITPEVQHMLEALGVRTLGQFAALPPPSVSKPTDADYQALARGEGATALRPYAPDGSIREEIALGGLESGLSGIEALAALGERVALRLAGRSRLASRLEVVAIGSAGQGEPVAVTPGHALATADELAEAVSAVVPPGAWRVRVTVVGEALTSEIAAATGVPTEVVAEGSAGSGSGPIDMMSVVLSTAGTGDLFGGLAPASVERHRRMRRGKQRRRVHTLPQQARLFDRP